ncbi:MAG: DMT family transporter [Rhodoferax sp.]|nr:DMT family transporter [Rhodoferax sp.]
MVLTVACFAAFDTLSKVAITFAPVTQTLWVRYAVQAVATTVWWAVWLRPTLGLRFFRTAHPRFHLARGLLLISCSTMTFVGLRYLPVGEFTAVAFISPMVAMMLSGWFLRDRVSRAQWWFAALSFAGAVIVIRPGSDLFGWAVVFPLALAALNALYQLITRRLATSADEHPVFAQWVSGWIATLVLLLPLLWPGTWASNLAPSQWAVLLAMGLLGTLGHFFFMHAVALESAAALAPYTYLQIAFAMAGGWLVFAHTPDGWAITGMLVIGLSGFVAGLRRARQIPPPTPVR